MTRRDILQSGCRSVAPPFVIQDRRRRSAGGYRARTDANLEGPLRKGLTMTMYLLSIYQPDGDPPPPDVLAKVMADIDVINRELEATGSWVFAGGLHPPTTATVVRVRDGDVLMTDG